MTLGKLPDARDLPFEFPANYLASELVSKLLVNHRVKIAQNCT